MKSKTKIWGQKNKLKNEWKRTFNDLIHLYPHLILTKKETHYSSVWEQLCSPAVLDFPGGSAVKIHLQMQKVWDWSLGLEDPLEQEMATQSSILGWEIPHSEEHGRLQSMELQKAAKSLTWLRDWAQKHALNSVTLEA